jgi:general secretion pathway protein K
MKRSQRGAALLLAMLTAAMVATLAATATWRIWQLTSVETAESNRAQLAWLLQGALDWSRLILREDARANRGQAVDHLNEPWALPLEEARLSTFLAARDSAAAQGPTTEAFLSGHITDMQGRFNLTNLWQDTQLSAPDVLALIRLLEVLRQDPTPWLRAIDRLDARTPDAALARPQRLAEWQWAGLSAEQTQALSPYVSVLPKRTPLNINTAPAAVIASAFASLSLSEAQALVRERSLKPFESTSDFGQRHPELASAIDAKRMATTSDFFEVTGLLRLDQHSVSESSLLQRNGLAVAVIWRERSTERLNTTAETAAP